MRRRVDPARGAAHDGHADVSQLIRQLASGLQTVVRRLPRTDHGHRILVLRGELPADIKHDRRIVNLAEQFGIILVRLREDSAAEISDAFELAIEVNRLLPVRDCLRGFFADAVHAKQLLPGGFEDGRCFAEALEQLPDTNGANVLDQVEGHEGFPAVHATDIADLTASGKAGDVIGRLPFPRPAGPRRRIAPNWLPAQAYAGFA